MRTLRFLTQKNERIVNRLIRDKKTSSYLLLYHSEWDKYSQAIVDRAAEWAKEEGDEVCYVVSSWELPHVFSAFGITSAPCLVEVANGDVKVFVEYPKVYDYFALKGEAV
jgi:hypothetical protein